MDKKILTLIVTLYDPTSLEIDNWLYIAELFNKSEVVEILFLNDNPNRDKELSEAFKNFNYVKANVNKGKFKLVKDAIDSGLVQSNYVKICDPDDLILIEELQIFVDRLSKLKDRTPFVRFEYSVTIFPDDWDVKNQDKLNTFKKLRKMSSLVNENSVIPTEDILNAPFNPRNQTKSSDVLFSLSSSINKQRDIVLMNPSFYIYNLHKGISNEISDANKTRTKFKNQREIHELFNFVKLTLDYKIQSDLETPSFYDYRWLHNKLIQNKNFLLRRILVSNNFFRMMKKADKGSKAWGKKFILKNRILYCWLYQLFKREIKW